VPWKRLHHEAASLKQCNLTTHMMTKQEKEATLRRRRQTDRLAAAVAAAAILRNKLILPWREPSSQVTTLVWDVEFEYESVSTINCTVL
jgi:hypothetical protein